MKQRFYTLLAVCLLVACHKEPVREPNGPDQEKPRMKRTSFRLFQHQDYTATIHDSTYAEVELSIYRTSLTGEAQVRMWDTLIGRQRLQLFPTLNQPLVLVKNIDSIYDSRQRLVATYIIKYDNQGIRQSFGSRIPYLPGVDTLQLDVRL